MPLSSRPLTFKAPIDRIREETFRLHLLAPPEYLAVLEARPDIIDEVANGVGTQTSWTYHLTPDTICGLNINPTSHIHDWMNTFPLYFPDVATGLAYKRLSESYFRINGYGQVSDGWSLLRPWRRLVINSYVHILSCFGNKAFWADKPLPADYGEYYADRPMDYPECIIRLLEIEGIIHDIYPGYQMHRDAP
ncbi:MAG: hypothetical protein PHQ27_04250 [Victivallales bacterium]|nr:hypothetical protein [Victivallales bacterium]